MSDGKVMAGKTCNAWNVGF